MSTYGNKALPWQLRLIRIGFKIGDLISPKLTGRLAYALFQTPLNHAPFKEKHQQMRAAEMINLPFKNGHLAVYHWPAKGPTILLTHGWESNATTWVSLIAKLRDQGYSVVAFDAPAHGKSSGRTLAYDLYAEAIGAVISHFREVEALVAHSFGVVGSSFYLLETSATPLERVIFVAGPNRPVDALEGFGAIVGLSERCFPHVLAALEKHAGMPAEEIGVGVAMQGQPLPGLVIHDEDDQIVAFDAAVNIVAGWPSARIYATRKLGHRRILRDEAVLNEIIGFLETDERVFA